MRKLVAVVVLLVLGAPAQAAELKGPPGTSDDKVLVIGIDGTRIDKIDEAIAAGDAPNLQRIRRDGFLLPTRLPYSPPEALTISEVGWSTIAAGVGPAKHGVNGFMLNEDPGQATKNGYLDFLTRIEAERPSLSTFLASDWANIGLHEHGGPIFGDAIDARFAIAASNSIEAYDEGDQQVADASERYLRTGNPDAGFVYFGVVDEVAHIDGSARPSYLAAIKRSDRRVGQLLSAISARRSFRRERWTVLLTTDHGQRDLEEGSALSHGGPSDLEETSFVGGFGFGISDAPAAPGIVDIAPTVLARLGIPIDPAWDLDGRALFQAAAVPAPRVRARRTKRGTAVVVLAPDGSPPLAKVIVRGRTKRADGTRKVRILLPRRLTGKVRVTVVDTDGTRSHQSTPVAAG